MITHCVGHLQGMLTINKKCFKDEKEQNNILTDTSNIQIHIYIYTVKICSQNLVNRTITLLVKWITRNHRMLRIKFLLSYM